MARRPDGCLRHAVLLLLLVGIHAAEVEVSSGGLFVKDHRHIQRHRLEQQQEVADRRWGLRDLLPGTFKEATGASTAQVDGPHPSSGEDHILKNNHRHPHAVSEKVEQEMEHEEHDGIAAGVAEVPGSNKNHNDAIAKAWKAAMSSKNDPVAADIKAAKKALLKAASGNHTSAAVKEAVADIYRAEEDEEEHKLKAQVQKVTEAPTADQVQKSLKEATKAIAEASDEETTSTTTTEAASVTPCTGVSTSSPAESTTTASSSTESTSTSSEAPTTTITTSTTSTAPIIDSPEVKAWVADTTKEKVASEKNSTDLLEGTAHHAQVHARTVTHLLSKLAQDKQAVQRELASRAEKRKQTQALFEEFSKLRNESGSINDEVSKAQVALEEAKKLFSHTENDVDRLRVESGSANTTLSTKTQELQAAQVEVASAQSALDTATEAATEARLAKQETVDETVKELEEVVKQAQEPDSADAATDAN